MEGEAADIEVPQPVQNPVFGFNGFPQEVQFIKFSFPVKSILQTYLNYEKVGVCPFLKPVFR